MDEELQQLRTNASNELMTDEDFIHTIEQMGADAQEREINDLLKAMHENRIVSWDEAERILQETDKTPVKSSLPEQTRPTEPDNDTDVDTCIQKLLDNDPSLKEINLNNMKRTPVPAIRRLIEALAYNEHCERLSLANMGLYDHDIIVLVTVVEMNQTLKKVNLETNYLSGEFFSKFFNAALNNETIEEIKAVNQGVSFSTQSEKEIIDAIMKNTGLTKISINFRLPEGRFKVEKATLRNGEIKRMKRREAALKAKQEAEALEKNPVPHLAKEAKKEPMKKVPPPQAKAPPLILPEKQKPAPKTQPQRVVAPLKPKEEPPKPHPVATLTPRASRESEEDTELVKSPPTEKSLENAAQNLKDQNTDHGDNAGDASTEKPKSWQPRRSSVVVDQSYAPVLNLVPSNINASVNESKPPERKPRPRGPPVTAKNLWEQRIAKEEKKVEKAKQRPLMSIQKIREMEKAELDVRLKKAPPKKVMKEKTEVEVAPVPEPKPAQVEPKPQDQKPAEEPKKERRTSVQKIIAKKPESVPQNPVAPGDDAPRPTTVIRRTVMRKRPDEQPTENGKIGEAKAPAAKQVVKKKKPKPDGLVANQTPAISAN